MSDSLRPHESQHARPPCPSPTPGVHSDSCPSSQWCHPAISSSVRPLLLLPLILPSIKVFSNESILCMRWPKYRSFSFNISPSNEYSRLISFRIDLLYSLNSLIEMQYLGASSKMTELISVHFQGKAFSITEIQVYAPTSNDEDAEVEQF